MVYSFHVIQQTLLRKEVCINIQLSFHYYITVPVLWLECGYQTVSLIDLVTFDAVKKVYMNATLNLHHVRPRGASLQQKCMGEKVFDILKCDSDGSLMVVCCVLN